MAYLSHWGSKKIDSERCSERRKLDISATELLIKSIVNDVLKEENGHILTCEVNKRMFDFEVASLFNYININSFKPKYVARRNCDLGKL